MRRFNLLLLCTLIGLPAIVVFAQSKAAKAVKRAQPPKFSGSDTFYADAFKEGLVGPRPANLGQASPTAPASSVPGSAPAPGSVGGVAGSGWAALISASTIEDEIKTLKLQVDQGVTTPSDFAGKGYKLARRQFSVLAMLLGIAGEYDADVRWKKEAPAARDAFARTAANAKVGTQQVWQEAKLRKDELGDLVNGGSPFAGKEAETKAPWKDIAGRAPLMQYLEQVWDPRLKPALADKSQFTANADKVLHDAEIFAAIGEVLSKDGMPDADSTEYKAFCIKLRDAAKSIAEAVKSKNFDQAASASATLGKACAECHENYRS
jgi:hypothetical protein